MLFRSNADLPQIPGGALRRAPKDEGRAEGGKKDRGDAKESDIERANPKVEQIAGQQRATAHSVFLFKIEHGHFLPLTKRENFSSFY